MEVETLSGSPSLAQVFVRAAVTSRGRGGDLPDRALRLEPALVDRGHLLRYQRVCAFAVDDLLPHTYPHILGFPLQAELMARRDFPLPLPGLVHLENEITVHRALTADDRLDITVRAADLRPHRKGTAVDLLTEVDCAGERVWEGRSTYLKRGRTNADADAPEAAPALPESDPAALWRLPEGLGRRYASASGDVNPIHLHALTARAMGFPRAIAHGMWTYSRTLAALGPHSAQPSTSRVWFKRPVLLPSTVALAVDTSTEPTVAGLRSSKDPSREHLVLTLAIG
jgi:acyl dehydratase